jgi:enoyl-CoA hydratase/carnithine racemase
MEPLVLRTQTADVTTLTLNRPSRLNAFTIPLLDLLLDHLASIGDESVAVVLRGAGRAFSSGDDLTADHEPNDSDGSSLGTRLQDLARSLRACPPPIIAAVQGYAVGGGAELALACDFIVAEESAQFGFPETTIGVTVTGGLSGLLPRIVGPARAKEIVLLGQRLSGAKAHNLGLINRVVPDGSLDDAVAEIISQLGTKSRAAIQANKKLIDFGLEDDLEGCLARELAFSDDRGHSEEFTQARLDFADRSRRWAPGKKA